MRQYMDCSSSFIHPEQTGIRLVGACRAPHVALITSEGSKRANSGYGSHSDGTLRRVNWFYDRFTVPTSFASFTGTPYLMQAIHQNGINQQSYVVNNPDFYDPNAPLRPAP
jgi:hypothetical protein